jgi:hypothetical protein
MVHSKLMKPENVQFLVLTVVMVVWDLTPYSLVWFTRVSQQYDATIFDTGKKVYLVKPTRLHAVASQNIVHQMRKLFMFLYIKILLRIDLFLCNGSVNTFPRQRIRIQQ